MILLVLLVFLSACYKGDPGYGGPDYPPEPPFSQTARDASCE